MTRTAGDAKADAQSSRHGGKRETRRGATAGTNGTRRRPMPRNQPVSASFLRVGHAAQAVASRPEQRLPEAIRETPVHRQRYSCGQRRGTRRGGRQRALTVVSWRKRRETLASGAAAPRRCAQSNRNPHAVAQAARPTTLQSRKRLGRPRRAPAASGSGPATRSHQRAAAAPQRAHTMSFATA